MSTVGKLCSRPNSIDFACMADLYQSFESLFLGAGGVFRVALRSHSFVLRSPLLPFGCRDQRFGASIHGKRKGGDNSNRRRAWPLHSRPARVARPTSAKPISAHRTADTSPAAQLSAASLGRKDILEFIAGMHLSPVAPRWAEPGNPPPPGISCRKGHYKRIGLYWLPTPTRKYGCETPGAAEVTVIAVDARSRA
jgi:hypothetical protein